MLSFFALSDLKKDAFGLRFQRRPRIKFVTKLAVDDSNRVHAVCRDRLSGFLWEVKHPFSILYIPESTRATGLRLFM